MPRYKRIFSVDVGRTQGLMLRNLVLAQKLVLVQRSKGLPRDEATVRRLQKVLVDLQRGLERVAKETAIDVNKEINKEITKTKSGRPRTGNNPNLRNQIKSRPIHRFGSKIMTGEVGVADIDVLDKLVNPRYQQYGPYWRAQEDGTKHQAGRVVYGGFYDAGLAGGPYKPDPALGGVRRAPHPIFVSTHRARAAYGTLGFSGGPGKQGGAGGGKMTIGKELKPRHFIRNGANTAAAAYRVRVAAVESQVLRDLAVVTHPSFGRGRRGRRP